MNRWSVVIGVTLHAVIASACASKVNGGGGSETGFLGCTVDSECGTGQSCVEKKCVDQSSRAGEAGAGGNGNTGGPALGCVDFSGLQSEPAVSFEQDLMPIFGLSCVASSCHDSTARKADLVLGDPSACGPPGTSCYDPTAKWSYRFPGPIPADLLATVISGLVNVPSKTVSVVMRVVPGDPSSSFLVDSVSGTPNSQWYTPQCQSQDPTRPGKCGSAMPLGSPSLCEDSPDKVRAIAAWISQGAQMN